MARPTTLTTALQARIVDGVRRGAHPVQAARLAGVAESTLRGWLNNPRSQFEAFRDAIAQAEAEAEVEAVEDVRRTDKRWWLERRYPERWSRIPDSRSQAAALVSIGTSNATLANEDAVVFTDAELRAASHAFLNRQRALHGQPALPADPYLALGSLMEDGIEKEPEERDGSTDR